MEIQRRAGRKEKSPEFATRGAKNYCTAISPFSTMTSYL